MPFFHWLRRLALQRLGWWRRFHLESGKRSVARDGNLVTAFVEESAGPAVNRLEGSGASPSGALIRDEECEQVRAVLDQLECLDRKLLELRYVEQFSLAEIGDRLGIGLSAVKMRHLRALKRFRGLVEGPRAESAS
jgi:RNA polymerase sigma-70 factor, ECF subfamily